KLFLNSILELKVYRHVTVAVFISHDCNRLARVMIAVVEKKDDFSADLFLETPGCQNLSDQITLRKKSARLLAKTNNRVLHRLERVLYPSRSLRTAEDRLLQDRREDQHGRASNQIIPEVTDIGRCEQDEDECLCKERREE